MTRKEKKILSSLIKNVIRDNKYYWHELKREIWDRGYQYEYESSLNFLEPISHAISVLPIDTKFDLISESNKNSTGYGEIYSDNFNSAYVLIVLEEIIRRAGIAAMRTTNWD